MNNKRIQSIDFLKVVAILLVILVHSSQRIPGINRCLHGVCSLGSKGVELFFLLSGFSLCMSWEKSAGQNPLFRYGSFLKKRAKTIMPMYAFFTFVWFAINFVLKKMNIGTPFASEMSLGAIVANMFCVHGFIPKYINNVVPGGWYIGTQMILYMFFPAIYKSVEIVENKKKPIWLVFAVACVLSLIHSILIMEFLPKDINRFIGFFAINNLPAFTAGIIMNKYKDVVVKNMKILTCVLVLLTVVTVFLYFQSFMYKSAIETIMFTVVYSMILKFSTEKEKNKTYGKLGRFIAGCGNITFEVYFVHPFFAWAMPSFIVNLMNLSIDPVIFWTAIFVVSVVLSFVCGKILNNLRKLVKI